MKLKFQQKIILDFIAVHAKENLNLGFIATRNHFEIGVMKRSFQRTFGNWRSNLQVTTSAGKYLCIERSKNALQEVATYA